MAAQQDKANNTDATPPWTAHQSAEDLIAQVEDALHGGWDGPLLLQALEHQGLEAATAAQLVADVGALPTPEGGAGDPPEVVVLLAARRFMRDPNHPLRVLDSRRDALSSALVAVGLPAATAAAVCSELAALERRGAELHFARMRRLGVQGMVVGGAATLFLGYGGLYGGPQARWHLTTAAVTLALAVYSFVLFRRGK